MMIAMKRTLLPLTGGALVLAISNSVYAQQAPAEAAPKAPAPTKPSAGLVNDWLRARSDSLHVLDVGGEFRVRFDNRAARWARERQHWSFVREEATAEGTVAVYAPDALDEIASWLFGWGTAAEVLSPPELRRRLRDEARALTELLT